MEEEIWKDIKGYEGLYQVSNLGRVKALEKKCWNGGAWWTMPESILKHTMTRGYVIVGLYKLDRKKGKNFFVHRILAEHFIPNPENKPFINHINHNRADNRINNMAFCDNYYMARFKGCVPFCYNEKELKARIEAHCS